MKSHFFITMNNYCNAIFPRGVINRRNFHDVKMHNFVIVYSYETCSHTLHDYDIITHDFQC